MSKVLITGGAGFIGGHLAETCVVEGHQVTVLDDFSSGKESNLKSCLGDVQLIESDIQDLDDNTLDLAQFDVVFHLAGNGHVPPSVKDPSFDFSNNLYSTFLLLEKIRSLPAKSRPVFINTSSAAVYGNPIRFPVIESDPTVPVSPYGVSKLGGERYVQVFSDLYQLQTASLRPLSVYGPRQEKQVIYDLFRKLHDNPDSLSVIGDGTQERDFVFVSDVVQAYLTVWKNTPLDGSVYNVAAGVHTSIKELVHAICKVSGATPTIEFTGSTRPGDADRWSVEIDKLRGYGYEPSISLIDGLERTYQWFHRAHEIDSHDTVTVSF
jgi:UDP-glucose 4-epimerase